MAQTGQRTTANARPTSATPTPSSAPSTASSSSSKRKSSKKGSSKKGNEFEFSPGHPFSPGQKVNIAKIDGSNVKEATVGKDGTLKVSGLDYGIYTASADREDIEDAPVDENTTAPQHIGPSEPTVSVTFAVKDNDAARKAKTERYGGIGVG